MTTQKGWRGWEYSFPVCSETSSALTQAYNYLARKGKDRKRKKKEVLTS
jgi:hypothetical protein